MTADLWQADYAYFRSTFPSRWAGWMHPRIVFVPAWVARLFGGAFIWLSWLFVGRDLLPAPFFARRYILALQWARVAEGHIYAGIGMFLCLGGMLLLMIDRPSEATLSLVFGLGAIALLAWRGQRARYEETDVAARAMVGSRAVRAGIVWLVEHRGEVLDEELLERLRRLEEI